MAGAMASSSFLQLAPTRATSTATSRMQVLASCRAQHNQSPDSSSIASISASSRRKAMLACSTTTFLLAINSSPAVAELNDEYKSETQSVIELVKQTLALEKTDPTKPNAVATLRQTSNKWVAKYRREKSLSGRASFSNMYSVLNAISGHYISFGPTSPIPAKRQQRILEEVDVAEKALSRGR